MPNNNPKRVELIEIKDLSQTLELEIRYDDMNAWLNG
jgi:hypothetical protein